MIARLNADINLALALAAETGDPGDFMDAVDLISPGALDG